MKSETVIANWNSMKRNQTISIKNGIHEFVFTKINNSKFALDVYCSP